MTSEEIAEALRAFRTMARIVGLFDARMWLRFQHRDLEWAMMDRINKSAGTTQSVFKASFDLWMATAEAMEAEHRG